MKTDHKEIQAVVDNIRDDLIELERSVKALHKHLDQAGKMLAHETDGVVVIQATGEPK